MSHRIGDELYPGIRVGGKAGGARTRNYYRPPGTTIHLHRIPLAREPESAVPVSLVPFDPRQGHAGARAALDTRAINPPYEYAF